MKLDRRHMVVSVVLLVASIIYNVWIFTRPAGGGRAAGAPAVSVQGAQAARPSTEEGPIDPAEVKELPDVALDRVPEWPRDPFGSTSVTAPVVAGIESAPTIVPDPDPVVGSILYSSDRRAAMVNGRIVRIGDTIGTALVVDILPKAVIIESADKGRQTLELKTPHAVIKPPAAPLQAPAARGARP